MYSVVPEVAILKKIPINEPITKTPPGIFTLEAFSQLKTQLFQNPKATCCTLEFFSLSITWALPRAKRRKHKMLRLRRMPLKAVARSKNQKSLLPWIFSAGKMGENFRMDGYLRRSRFFFPFSLVGNPHGYGIHVKFWKLFICTLKIC